MPKRGLSVDSIIVVHQHRVHISANSRSQEAGVCPARILVAIGGKDNDSPHLEYKQRWVNQYNFYLNDRHWGPMLVRMRPYFPFSARVCLNQHYWRAIRMRSESRPGPIRSAVAGHESDHRPAEEDHDDLRAEGHQRI